MRRYRVSSRRYQSYIPLLKKMDLLSFAENTNKKMHLADNCFEKVVAKIVRKEKNKQRPILCSREQGNPPEICDSPHCQAQWGTQNIHIYDRVFVRVT